MKKLLQVCLLVASLVSVTLSAASKGGGSGGSGTVSVGGYTKSNGTYVAPYTRTAPNNTVSDNYSTKGNVNPYTGKEGTKNVTDGGSVGASSGDAAAYSSGFGDSTGGGSIVVNSDGGSSQADLGAILAELKRINERIDGLEKRLALLDRQPVAQASVAGAVTLDSWHKMHTGLSVAEVKTLLGEPTRVDWPYWYYADRGSVHFTMDKSTVFSWVEPGSL